MSSGQKHSVCEEIRKFLDEVPFTKSEYALLRIRYWFFPWLSNDHYCVFVVDFVSKTCSWLDSQPVKKEEEFVLVNNGLKLAMYLFHYLNYIGKLEVDVRSYTFNILQNVPKQSDNIHCGLFVLLFCQCYLSGWQEGAIDPTYFINWRLQAIATEEKKDLFERMVLREDNKWLPMLLESALKWRKPMDIQKKSKK